MSGPTISFVAPSAYPLGGVATWLDRIVPDLRAQGVSARVVLVAGDHHDADTYQIAHPAIAPAVVVRSLTSTRESRIQALASALATPGQQTLVSVNIPDALLAVARMRTRQRAHGLRAVMSIHGLEPDLFADLAALAPLVDGVICSNRLAQARAAATPGLDRRRVHYAPYGTPLEAASPPRRNAGGDLTIGFAGRFERFQKRVQDLDPIARALAVRGVGARWLLAGDGPDRGLVEAMARHHGKRVERLGRVEAPHMLRDFHRRCDVLLNPSEWETGPIVVWEAMASGVAIVSSRYTGSAREGALRDGDNCLLFDVGDVDGAASCLQRMTDGTLRTQLSTRARALVLHRYSPTASCVAWRNALEAIAEMPVRTAPEPGIPPAGRLDRWLGTHLAESLRSRISGRYRADGPGDEWPHTHAGGKRDDPAHWEQLRALDVFPANWSPPAVEPLHNEGP